MNELIQLPKKPYTPKHAGEALNGEIRSHWIEYLFNCFDKMHNSGTLSCPFLRKLMPEGKKTLPKKYLLRQK